MKFKLTLNTENYATLAIRNLLHICRGALDCEQLENFPIIYTAQLYAAGQLQIGSVGPKVVVNLD